MRSPLRRLAALTLCLLLALSSAQAAGMRFDLQADVNAPAFPEELQPLADALSQLLEVSAFQGSLVTDDGAFRLDVVLQLTDGATGANTTLQVYGISSHWGVRSSLLGDAELMINCASLLPFGVKARDYLGLPLDMAALLVPYTHVDAFARAMEVLAPLFPAEDGKTRLTRAEVDAIVSGLDRLCDEDPALNRYLEVTGLYHTAKYYCRRYFDLPEWLFSSLTVRREGRELTWTSGVFTILKLREKNGELSVSFSLPTLARMDASLTCKGDQTTGRIVIDMDSLQADIAFSLPSRLTGCASEISLSVDASSPILQEEGVHLRVRGTTQGNDVTLQLLQPDTNAPLLTVTGTLVPFAADPLPTWTPEDFTGVNLLSVNSDSLQALLSDVKWPLLTGIFDLVAAAPARAVQQLMDYAEDAGLIDLLVSAMDGGVDY